MLNISDLQNEEAKKLGYPSFAILSEHFSLCTKNAWKAYYDAKPKSRCCGRCDGVYDICIADQICDDHKKEGCRICWPDPQ